MAGINGLEFRMIHLILSLLLAIIVPEVKQIPNDRFLVSFEKGATDACLHFTQLSGEGRPYTFHVCRYFVETNVTNYMEEWAIEPMDVDWDVYAEIIYDKESVETNHLKVHR
jgi:hypothetical protein